MADARIDRVGPSFGAAEESDPDDSGYRKASVWQRLSRSSALWIGVVDVILVLVFGFMSQNHVFLSVASFRNLGFDSSEALILTIGVALLFGAGEFDISLGANLILSSVAGGEVIRAVAPNPDTASFAVVFPIALLACVGTGCAIGLVNAFAVTRLRLNSLIATLATMGAATGLADLITNGSDIPNLPPVLQTDFGVKSLGGAVPLPALVALALLGVALFVVTKTRFGLRLLAIGSSRQGAERAGLRVKGQLAVAFCIAGGLAGIAGMIDLTRFATTNIGGHTLDGMAAVAGAIIGGTSFAGGRVSMAGALTGSILAIILQDGLVIVGISAFYQQIAIGVILAAAVYMDQQRRRGSRA